MRVAMPMLAGLLLVVACENSRPPTEPLRPSDLPLMAKSTAAIADFSPLLARQIDALVAAGVLGNGEANSLIAKLDAAAKKLANGDTDGAAPHIASFAKHVESLVDKGVLSAAQGAILISAGQNALAGGLALIAIAAAEAHSCGLAASGVAYCWGRNTDGQLGDGTTTSSLIPVAVASNHLFVAIAAGGSHTCALTADGAAHCWGRNASGQLGVGTTASSSVPVPVASGLQFSEISATTSHTCALDTSGTAYCWGDNRSLKLGVPATTEMCPSAAFPCSTVPVAVSGGLQFASISAAVINTCARTGAGVAYCWGDGGFGQFGDGPPSTGCAGASVTPRCSARPLAIPGLPAVTDLKAGGAYACAVAGGSGTYCWGVGVAGQLGHGAVGDRRVATLVSSGVQFDVIRPNGENNILGHTCAMTPAREAYCWGSNQFGQLGAPSASQCLFGAISFTCGLAPQLVSGGHAWEELDTGIRHTCGVSAEGIAYCWGSNRSGVAPNLVFGQLGDGSTEDRATPVRVAVP